MNLLAFTHKEVAECAETCPEWWYKEDGSECVEEAWRKNTAIAVPVVVVVAVIAAVLAVLLVRRKMTPKAQKAQNGEKGEENEK